MIERIVRFIVWLFLMFVTIMHWWGPLQKVPDATTIGWVCLVGAMIIITIKEAE
ncbi:hypothetical protein LCGC14_1687020 [marine sediment metagenome]|uniref:Uncharacterized protein n=1 Tax=marine sediment metagenome TaxID=412755 RepID=A0A0F9HMC2_9ZZZZ